MLIGYHGISGVMTTGGTPHSVFFQRKLLPILDLREIELFLSLLTEFPLDHFNPRRRIEPESLVGQLYVLLLPAEAILRR